MQNIENDLRNLVAEILERDPNSIGPDTRFIEDLGVDSMMALEIFVAIERKYKITLPQETLPKITTLKAATEIAEEYIAKNNQVHA